MRMNKILLLFSLFICVINSSPIEQGRSFTLEEATGQNNWDDKIVTDIQKIIRSHALIQTELKSKISEQVNLVQSSELRTTGSNDASVGNLMNVVNRLTLESANAVSNHESLISSYSSRKSQIESELAVPEQLLRSRLEQRQMCEREAKAISQLNEQILNGLNENKEHSSLREMQSMQSRQMTSSMKSLNDKNQNTLFKIVSLLSEEIQTEKQLEGISQFDSVSLRQKEPEDMLRHAKELSTNLAKILRQKTENEKKALAEISKVFSCSDCQEKEHKLEEVSASIQSTMNLKLSECKTLAEQHKILDEADREKTLALKKELDDLETAHKLREKAEESLKQQRDEAENVAKKMVELYKNVAKPSN